MSTAGNVNGDAYSDIIVGAPGDLTLVISGQSYIFHGSSSGITATSASGANTTLNGGITNNTLFGYSVSNAGDVEWR